MIEYLTHQQINKTKWDGCIANSYNELIYAYSWFLDIVSPHWDCLVYDDYKAVMPLTWSKKFGILYLYSPIFTQQLGVFSKDSIDTNLLKKFVENIPTKFVYIDINLNSRNYFHKNVNGVKVNQNYELPLLSKYDFIFKNFKGNTRRNINKSKKNGLHISESVNLMKIINLFKTDKGRELQNIKNEKYDMLNALLLEGEKRNVIKKYGVYTSENKLVAGAVFVFTKSKMTFIFSGNSAAGKEMSAMFFLIDHAIQKHCNTNLVLDFEGGNIPGMSYFYGGFGSRIVTYTTFKQNNLPWYIKWFKK